MRILLVEDDELLGDGIRSGLTQYQYTVDWVKNGLAAWSALQTEHFDLVILDLGLPKLSGEEILKNIRAKNISVPVIILTAHDAMHSRIKGFDDGADDYIVKPFNLEELCARIRAIRRRTTAHKHHHNTTMTVGDITLDPTTRLVFKSGQMVELSRREFVLLQMLLENSGKVLSREQATQSLYGWGYDIDSNALEVHIHNLRKKLKCKNITTIRGVGYMLAK
ncbi:MAG TPA: DNA-binding response regulator [Coxiellaceae bacterium]|nr:MAG: DNA-binding response regulator [Gammaproteobacteria bacterium RBG_16_37_9]HBC71698.1 DNA-binding response regulator [Coxiellaceae bacterium]HBS51400.1 DNA-binding response regulator [Coxiellaceae bacterium]HBY55621.1 DNA-binding response regulator [Coxiellaceae bacterium]